LVIVAGTAVPLPDSQDLSADITANGTNTIFTVAPAGRYYLSYQVNLTTGLALGSRLVINGTNNLPSTVNSGLVSTSYNNSIIVTLIANSTITLQLFSLIGTGNLISGAGATLSIIRLS
jgi:hypothetical protein